MFFNQYRKDVLDGKIFPQDSDLAKLGPYASKLSVALKLNIVSLLEDMTLLIKRMQSEDSNLKMYDSVWNLFVAWVKVNRDKHLLMKHTHRELSLGTFSLALKSR